jgi:hypothetical protein
MPVQKGFERTPKTGGSQFGFSSATDLVARWTLFPEAGISSHWKTGPAFVHS